MANANLVLGKNVVILKYDEDSLAWLPFACARSGSFSIETDSLETSITGAGKFRTYLPVANSYSGSMDGVTQLETANNLSVADLMALQIAHTMLLMRFEDTSNQANVFVKEGMFFISNITQTASFDNVATFSVALQGTGAITLIYTPTPIIIQGKKMYREQFIVPQGQSSVTLSAVTGVSIDNIINISVDGFDYPVIISAGTPIGQEVKYNPAGAVLTFPSVNDFSILYGFIEYQKT